MHAVFHACSYNWPTGGWLSSQIVGTLLRYSWHSSEIQFFLECPFSLLQFTTMCLRGGAYSEGTVNVVVTNDKTNYIKSLLT